MKKLIPASFVFLTLVSCYKEDDYLYNSDDVLSEMSVEYDASPIRADGSSQLTITYKFPANSDPSLTKLLVIASNGSFLETGNDSVQVTLSKLSDDEKFRYAEIVLQSTASTSDCILRTEVLSYYRNDTIQFSAARPTGIAISGGNFYFDNNAVKEFNYSVSVNSLTGLGSSGQKVFLSSAPAVGILSTSEASTGASGTVNFTYVFVDTSFTGTIQLTAKTLNEGGDTLTATKSIEVID